MRFYKLTGQLLTLTALLAALPSQAAVTQTVKREFDQLGRLAKVIQADGSWEAYGYDPNGNRIYSHDNQGRLTNYEYDSFNRLIAITDPNRKITKMTYDGRGNLVKVTDPRGLTTEYQYNGFSELVKQISPDTGTSTQTRETHGRVTSHTNAAGQTTQFKYDQFGRLIAQAHQGGPNWTFQRDSLGRLTEVTDAAGTTRYGYDSQSRLQSKTQQVGSLTQTVSYRRNAANQLAGITTPSGRVIDYTHDKGQIVAIQLDGQPLLTQVVYQPLGGIQGWTWANGLHHTRLYDANGRLYRFESAGIIAKRLVFDGAGNVEKLEDLQNTAGTQRFGYDRLDRLTNETATNRTDVYQYDENGNRISVTRNGTPIASQIDPASNRLIALASQTRIYTATGHLQSDGSRTFEYDGAERLVKVSTNGKIYEYQHNAWGQRLVKPGVRFVYDEVGRLLGEYQTDGSLIQETVWLGALPIATIRPNPTNPSQTKVYYVHPDHLGSPRAVSDPISNKAVWRWESDAFGQGSAEEDPDQDKQKFVYHLRFPGQYFDQETELNYNFFRDYDPATGRYLQSDPIGLIGGINTYAYVIANPLLLKDPYGLLFDWATDTPSIPQVAVDFSAGFGNGISGGASDWIRDHLFNGGQPSSVINECSPLYNVGNVAGNFVDPTKGIFKAAKGVRRLSQAEKAAKNASPAKTIIEEARAVKKADSFSGQNAESYEKIKDLLSQGKAGGNQHALHGDLAGKYGVDVAGSGKGRGKMRVVYSINDNEVTIHDVYDYHRK